MGSKLSCYQLKIDSYRFKFLYGASWCPKAKTYSKYTEDKEKGI